MTRGAASRAGLVECLTSRVLFWGGALSIGVVLVGLLLQVELGAPLHASTVQELLSPDASARAPGVFVSPAEIGRGLRPGPLFNPLAVVALGLGLLLLTPVVGVAVSVPAYLLVGDRQYALISAMVLVILIVSFLTGRVGG